MQNSQRCSFASHAQGHQDCTFEQVITVLFWLQAPYAAEVQRYNNGAV